MKIASQPINFDMEIPSHTRRAELFAKDPVAAAVYYNTVLDAFCDYLLGYKQDNGDLFGHVSAYNGMTEEKLTGTLHNHMLVWLQNSPSPTEIQEKFKNEEFRDRLLEYLEIIIKQSYPDTDITDDDLNVSEVSCKYPINPDDYVDNPTAFEENLNEDVYKLVKVANTHSCRHKYRKNKICRFGYPRDIVEESTITDVNIILLKRLREMVNNYNPYMMTCLRSNHDIKFVPSGKDGYNIAFYVSEYAIKYPHNK